ncbi:sensor histidine kinase [Sphingomonas tabacisoli]|uniref:histidine kinase n=1 Tax=Sphingomonas tabacisoli TaxID=2249466 RepID=A0ABW4I5C7_9SPHN
MLHEPARPGLSYAPEKEGEGSFADRLSRAVSASPSHHPFREIAIGVTAALVAVAVRYALPLSSYQLPTLPVVVALAFVTTFVGMIAGITAALIGGLLSWYLFFEPFSWELTPQGVIPLVGFSITATVIITTSHLYRTGERREHARRIAELELETEQAELFAREMAHRVKNNLAVVQSVALQTLGLDSPPAIAFSERLQAIARAQDLLNEDARQPSAEVALLVNKALTPFDDSWRRIEVQCPAGIRVEAREAISLALALHELATNAAKHGSLSGPTGRVSLKIERVADRVSFLWVETGGPPVARPERSGFGTRLLRRLGSGELNFETDGVRCTWSLPASEA